MRMALGSVVVAALIALVVGLTGCGGGDGGGGTGSGGTSGGSGSSGSSEGKVPILGQTSEDSEAAADLGFPDFATRNTTRVGSADPVATAAAVALAVYPSRDADTRPSAVALADTGDWRVAASAAQLMAPPLRAPLLLSDGGELPPASEQALGRLIPSGAKELGGTQVVRLGAAANVDGYKSTPVAGDDYAAVAAGIDKLVSSAAGKPSEAVVVASADQPGFSMPAAAWAAKAGDPLLWVTRDAVPSATRDAIVAHKRPRIYVLGPDSAVSKDVLKDLDKLGTVRRIAGADPVANAIAFARFSDGEFGWNVVDPGHGLVFESTQRPLDAGAAAPLSGSGTYGPALLVTSANAMPAPLQDYLLDIQPGYDKDPVRGVYNHGWIIGDDKTVAVDVQARIDSLLEIQPVDKSSGSGSP